MKTKKHILHLGIAITAALAALDIAKAETAQNTNAIQGATTQPLHPLPNANAATPATPNNLSNGMQHTETGWLGIALAPVPAVLANQLGNLIPHNQGVMVQSVSPNSPAEKIGLQPYDVILSLDEQKLYSPRQLAQLVSSKPAKQVNLKVVHQGQLKDIPVTLGKRSLPQQTQRRAMSAFPPGWPPRFRSVPMMPVRPMQPIAPPSANTQGNSMLAWDSFESVQVKTLPDGRYHAEVRYKDAKGEVKNFTFEGKQDEITQQINKQADLPEDKKQALLNALNMKPNTLLNHPLFNQPFFSQPFANDPFFNDPFFRQGFGAFPNINNLFTPMPAPALPGTNSNVL